MSEYLIKDTTLIDIGNAIREKTEKSGTILVANFAEEIRKISSGSELNFKIVGGDTAPSNPEENTIWINTSTPITSWEFSATQPIAATGKVWINIATSSTAAFNTLKNNGIMVYPFSAKQYVSGAWVNKTAKTYQNGKWVDWTTYLYNSGNECSDITGGWIVTNTAGTITKGTNSIVLDAQGGNGDRHAAIYTKNKIDVSAFNSMTMNSDWMTYHSPDAQGYFGLFDTPPTSWSVLVNPVTCLHIGMNDQTVGNILNLSSITGQYYVGGGIYVGGYGPARLSLNIKTITLDK